MATYEYSCRSCGPFDVRLAIGSAPSTHECPVCSGAARRVYSPPGVVRTSPAAVFARESEERSREAPEVVSQVPEVRGGPRRSRPLPAGLPRP